MTARTGLQTMESVTHKAWVDHMVDNGLPAPTSITLDDGSLSLWVRIDDAPAWGESIHVDATTEDASPVPGLTHIKVDGRLPLLGIKVRLHFLRRDNTGRHLQAVAG